MGCDIQYFLDHDFDNLSPEVFLQEFKKRISSVQLYISNSFDDVMDDVRKFYYGFNTTV